MITAETIYQKANRLDAFRLQEVADFIDFLADKTPPVEKSANASEAMENSQPSPLYQAFEAAGLIGCLATDEQFASTYKQKLDFSHKHGTTT